MKTNIILLGHDVVITPSIDTLDEDTRDDIIDEIIDKIIDGAGCLNISGMDYEWEIEEVEGMRDTVKKAFLDALEVKKITLSDETVKSMLEDILENMWQAFNYKVEDLLSEPYETEEGNKFIWVDDLRIALQPLSNKKIEAIIQDKQAKELFQGEFFTEREAIEFCKSWILLDKQGIKLTLENYDAIIQDIRDWHSDCEYGKDGNCDVYHNIHSGASDDELIDIALDVDPDLFEKYKKEKEKA